MTQTDNAIRSARWRLRHPEKAIASQAAYRERNLARLRQENAAWQRRNRQLRKLLSPVTIASLRLAERAACFARDDDRRRAVSVVAQIKRANGLELSAEEAASFSHALRPIGLRGGHTYNGGVSTQFRPGHSAKPRPTKLFDAPELLDPAFDESSPTQ